jgi:hypothetical protein
MKKKKIAYKGSWIPSVKLNRAVIRPEEVAGEQMPEEKPNK